MERRTFLKAASAAVALVALPVIEAKAAATDWVIEMWMPVSPQLETGFYLRFPSGVEFVLMEDHLRKVPREMQFMATHIYSFKRGGWIKNRWPTGVLPHSVDALKYVRRVTREELIAEGKYMYRTSADPDVREMSVRVNRTALYAKISDQERKLLTAGQYYPGSTIPFEEPEWLLG